MYMHYVRIVSQVCTGGYSYTDSDMDTYVCCCTSTHKTSARNISAKANRTMQHILFFFSFSSSSTDQERFPPHWLQRRQQHTIRHASGMQKASTKPRTVTAMIPAYQVKNYRSEFEYIRIIYTCEWISIQSA